MDVEVGFWAARVLSSKHLSAMQNSALNSETHLWLDDSEGDDDMRACFPCPFCYLDIEVDVLCPLLQEEHCFDVKNVVCPVCAENLGRDMIEHFTLQHAHMLKRRKKSQKTGPWMGSAMLGKGLQEVSSCFGDGVSSTNRRINTADSMPDPLLSPFLYGVAVPDAKDAQVASSVNEARVMSTSLDAKSTELSTSNGDRKQDDEERQQRAEFIQQLILSTVF